MALYFFVAAFFSFVVLFCFLSRTSWPIEGEKSHLSKAEVDLNPVV